MAILHADNFTIYGYDTGRMLEGVYAERAAVNITADPDGVSTNTVLECVTGGNNTGITNFRYVFQNGAVTSVGTSFRVWLNNLPVDFIATPILAVILDIGGGQAARLRVLPTGQIGIFRENDTLYAATPVPVITAKGWYHIEVRYDLTPGSPSLLKAEVRVEGLPVLVSEGMEVSQASLSQMLFANSNNFGGPTVRYYLKDFVVWDTTGSQNKDFLGSVLVTTLSVDGDISLNWTPSVGTEGYPILDNVPPDNAQYISAEDSPLPAPYVGTLSNLPPEVTSVKALVSYVRAAKSDGGDGTLQTSLISSPDAGPETVDGANRPITVAQTYWRDIFEIDPKTNGPWLPGSVNNVRVKINRTS